MGGGGSKRLTALKRFGQNLTESEKQLVNDCFDSISCSKESETFSQDQFNAYVNRLRLSLPSEFTSRLFQTLCQDGTSHVTFASFVSGLSLLLKYLNGTSLHRLCGGPALTLLRFEEHLAIFISVALQSDIAQTVFPHFKQWPPAPQAATTRLSEYLTRSLLESSETTDPSRTVSPTELDRWMRSCPLGSQLVKLTVAYVFCHEAVLPDPKAAPRDVRAHLGMEGSEYALLPRKIQHPLFREDFPSALLDLCSWTFLNSCFPSHLKGRVFPLFSSVRHGQSFSTFCRQLLVRGPTLLVIKDTGGNVFGGFAADGWRYGPQFIGSANCFLYSLQPTLGAYYPTGYNNNYMYLQQNAQTLPNGLGMGGQLNYFGLWISAEYGTGHSKAAPKCSTYGSPVLSHQDEFHIDVMEVWGIGDPVIPDAEEGGGEVSILDRDKGATAILELAGKTSHSKGLREQDTTLLNS